MTYRTGTPSMEERMDPMGEPTAARGILIGTVIGATIWAIIIGLYLAAPIVADWVDNGLPTVCRGYEAECTAAAQGDM